VTTMGNRRRQIDMKTRFTPRLLAAVIAAFTWATVAAVPDAAAQEVRIEDSAITLSSGSEGRAELWIRLADGAEHRVTFDDGAISVDGRDVGEYETDGRLAAEWRAVLRDHAGAEGSRLRDALLRLVETLQDWIGDERESETAETFADRLGNLLGLDRPEEEAEVAEAAAAGVVAGGRLAIAPGGVAFDELVGQLDALRGALRQLGGAAGLATDNLAMIVHDDFAIDAGETVAGNLALLDGTLVVSGHVGGDVLVLDGDLVLADGATVDGDILQVGGDVELRGDAAVIAGEIIADVAAISAEVVEVAEAVAPEAPEPSIRVERRSRSTRGPSGPFGRFARNLGMAAEELMGAVTTFIALGLLGLLLVYFARPRVEMVADTVRHEFARSFAMGLAAEVLFFPALLVLCVLVITLPIVPFFVLGTIIAMLAGYVAVAHGAGEMFAQRRYRYEWLERLRRSNSYYYVLSGLVLLLLPFAAAAVLWMLGGTAGFVRGLVAFVAAVGTWILATAGFGSVLLTRGGSRSIVVDWSDAHGGEYTAAPMGEPSPESGVTDDAPEPGDA
jgi:hypothetical protein